MVWYDNEKTDNESQEILINRIVCFLKNEKVNNDLSNAHSLHNQRLMSSWLEISKFGSLSWSVKGVVAKTRSQVQIAFCSNEGTSVSWVELRDKGLNSSN